MLDHLAMLDREAVRNSDEKRVYDDLRIKLADILKELEQIQGLSVVNNVIHYYGLEITVFIDHDWIERNPKIKWRMKNGDTFGGMHSLSSFERHFANFLARYIP